MQLFSLLAASASLLSLSIALPTDNGLTVAGCHCTTNLQRLFCGYDYAHLDGDDCDPGIVYLCPGPVGIQAIVFEDCRALGLGCNVGADGLSIMSNEVAETHCKGPSIATASQVVTRADKPTEEVCRRASKVSGDHCGWDQLHVVGPCDPLTVYECAGTIGQPALFKEHCPQHEVCKSSIFRGLGESHCVPIWRTTHDLATRSSDPEFNCTCPVLSRNQAEKFPAGFCGDDTRFLQGSCDSLALYKCPFPGTGSDPASVVRRCPESEKCAYMSMINELWSSFPQCSGPDIDARAAEE